MTMDLFNLPGDIPLEIKKVSEKEILVTPLMEITVIRSEDFRNVLLSICNQDIDSITLDFQNIEFIDSYSLGIILMTYKMLLDKNKGRINIINANERIKTFFNMIQLEKVINYS